MTTERALRTHRLVSQRWRVRRMDGDALWLAHPVDDPEAAAPFHHFGDALTWARQQYAIYGVSQPKETK